MKEKSKVELYERIRRDKRFQVLSIRALADRHSEHRRTVREALESANPTPRRPRRVTLRRWVRTEIRCAAG